MLSWMALSFGIYLTSWFTFLPAQGWSYVAAALIALLIISKRRPCFILALFIMGLLWGVEYGHRLLDHVLPPTFEGVELWLEGEVTGLPKGFRARGQSGIQFDLKIKDSACRKEGAGCIDTLNKVRLKWYNEQIIIPGQHWRLLVKLKRPYGLANPGSPNFQSYLMAQGLSATGYVREHNDNYLLPRISYSIDRYRWQALEKLEHLLASAEHSAILKALLLGDRRSISREQWDLFTHTGIVHLMVISGLHIGLMATLGFWLGHILSLLLSSLFNNVQARQCSAVMATVFAVTYSAAAGFSLPTQRAVIVVLVVMAGAFFNRELRASHTLSVALALCLLIDPLAPIGLSFWLSFCAVVIILYSLTGKITQASKAYRLLFMQLAIFIGMVPVLGLLLGFVSLISPVCNLVLVPIFSIVVVPLNAFAALLSLLNVDWAISIWLGLDQTLQWIFSGLLWIDSFSREWQLEFLDLSVAKLLLSSFAIVILLAPKGFPAKYLALFLLIPLFIPSVKTVREGTAQITVLDAGQGLSIVVKTAKHSMVYDVGAASSDFSIAQSVVFPYLKHNGIKQLDKLIISHNDNDHAGDWRYLASRLVIGSIDRGESFNGINKSTCVAGQRWNWDGVQFEYLSPLNSLIDRAGNNRSCVLKISVNEHAALLTGDIEREVELSLVKKYGKLIKAELLIAPHHGSKTSSSWPFIRTVDPDYVIFATGYRNAFSHPNSIILARYMSLPSETYNTASTGAITFILNKNGVQKKQLFRDSYPRYWL
jgi:competence protein ComEC